MTIYSCSFWSKAAELIRGLQNLHVFCGWQDVHASDGTYLTLSFTRLEGSRLYTCFSCLLCPQNQYVMLSDRCWLALHGFARFVLPFFGCLQSYVWPWVGCLRLTQGHLPLCKQPKNLT